MSERKAQIVVAYDFSVSAELALQNALQLALEDENREFHFLVVLDPAKGLGLKQHEVINYDYAEEVQKLTTERIQDALKGLETAGTLSLMVHVRIGEPVAQVLALAEEVGANLIVIGSHGRTGVKRMILGSVSEKVVREAHCPVLVARERTYDDVERATIVDAKPEDHGPEYVPPHRFHYDSGMAPKRPKAWLLY